MLPNPQLSRVVLLGTGDHHSDQLPALPAVRRNLIDLDAVLSSPPDGIVGPDQCVVVLNPDSPRSFMGQLRKNANQAEDLLLVYYAGHGVRHDRKDKLYLSTRETDPEELDGTAVPFEAVADVIESSFAQTRLLILDCCYSGLALGKMSAVVPDLQSIRIAGTTVITSCPPNEISLAPVGERNTAFTGELLELLRNGSPVPGAPSMSNGCSARCVRRCSDAGCLLRRCSRETRAPAFGFGNRNNQCRRGQRSSTLPNCSRGTLPWKQKLCSLCQ